MNSDAAARRLAHNLALYPWYVVAQNALFWMPVFFLYFAQRVPLAQVLVLEAVYYAAVVVLEVPSGYASDRLGRRPTLLVSGVTLTAAHLAFVLADGLPGLLLGQVLLAAGIACNSGTDTTLHLDTLTSLSREGEYAGREARISGLALWSNALAALAGGAAATLGGLWLAYLLSAVAAVVVVVVAWLFVEPRAHAEGPTSASFTEQLRRCAALARSPALAWLFAVAVVAVAVNHIPYELYQPYLALVARQGSVEVLVGATPLVAGLHVTVVWLLAGLAARRSIALQARFGLRPLLLTSLAVQGALLLTMGLWLHPLVAALLLLRGLGHALQQAPINAAVAPQLPSTLRATYLSLQSLAGRLAFALVLVCGSLLVDTATLSDGQALARLALSGAACVAVAVAALGAWHR